MGPGGELWNQKDIGRRSSSKRVKDKFEERRTPLRTK